MKHITLLLTLILSAASTSLTDEGLRVLYHDPSGRMSLTVSQNIEVVMEPPVHAGREFAFDLTFAADPDGSVVTVTIDTARASYEAHEMKQRVGTRHLTGKTFPLSIGDGGRRLEQSEAFEELLLDLGAATSPGFSIAAALVDSMPMLPDRTVAVGTSWTTERPIRSLQGWTWTAGQLKSNHRVTAVEQRGAHTIVFVTTEAEASLDLVDEDKDGSGTLKRKLDWTFDATDGRLLSMSMEQETEGDTVVPQGEIRIRQLTRVELAPIS